MFKGFHWLENNQNITQLCEVQFCKVFLDLKDTCLDMAMFQHNFFYKRLVLLF